MFLQYQTPMQQHPASERQGREKQEICSSLMFAVVTIFWSLIQALQNCQRNKLTRLDAAAAKTKDYSTLMRIKITYELREDLL